MRAYILVTDKDCPTEPIIDDCSEYKIMNFKNPNIMNDLKDNITYVGLSIDPTIFERPNSIMEFIKDDITVQTNHIGIVLNHKVYFLPKEDLIEFLKPHQYENTTQE